MMKQVTSEQVLVICSTMPLDEKAKLIKQLLSDSKVLFCSIPFFEEEQIANILSAIAKYITSRAS